jgi:multidrug resistance efflux pump
LIGQAEPVVSDVSCHKTGVLWELNVSRFQRVKTGDRIGQVMIVDPQVMTNSLAVIRADIEMLRATLMPITQRQRTAMEYDKYRLNWLQERVQLATARAELAYAESEFRRMELLFKEKPPIVSERQYDQAKEQRDRRLDQVNELSRVVSECETQFQELQLTNTMDLSRVTSDPLAATIALEESKLRLTESEQIPVIVKAPMDGIVTLIYHRVGEAVTPGLPIVALATLEPVRIVGYLRPPILREPKPGMKVSIRTRGLRRQSGSATILEVGTQLEIIPATLLGPVNFASIVQGLPLNISLPSNLKIRAGEVVDITLAPGAAQ